MKIHYLKNVLFTLFLLATPNISNAASIAVNFAHNDNDTHTPPFVGSGTFSFDGIAADGVFLLQNVSNFNFDFSFSGDSFTNDDIETPLEEILIIISESGTQVNFSNTGDLSGPSEGSIDFFNGNNNAELTLSFEPDGGDLYFTESFFGAYAPTAVPAPAALWLFASGLIGLIGMSKKQF